MHMRACCAAGFADQGNGLTFNHAITNTHQITAVVRVSRDVAVAMIDFDDIDSPKA